MAAYYNENDPKAAAWLRALINEGLIANGDVDERSIKDVKSKDLEGFEQIHFFAGIGGWSYALRLAGVSDDQPVWTGSCPCQPFSSAGRRKGESDDRHLWPDMLRLIAERQPATIFGEQVASGDGRKWFARVRADLEALGYAAGCADLCAAGVGAPHIRQRLLWVGNSNSTGRVEGWQAAATTRQRRSAPADGGGLPDTSASRLQNAKQTQLSGSRRQVEGRTTAQHGSALGGLHNTERIGRRARTGEIQARRNAAFWSEFVVISCRDGKLRRIKPGISPLVDGISGRVAQLRGLGNAIVPQVAARFIRASIEAIKEQS